MEPADSRRPFRALLDVGLVKTTTGNRVFGALKVFHANMNNLPMSCILVTLIFINWVCLAAGSFGWGFGYSSQRQKVCWF